MSDDDFFIILKRADGKIQGHAIRHGSVDKDSIDSIFSESDKDSPEAENRQNEEAIDATQGESRSPLPETFWAIDQSFSQAMLMYRKSVFETIKFAPFFASLRLGINTEKIAVTKGTRREDLSADAIDVYSLPSHTFSSLKRHVDSSEALIEGAKYLPRISTIGIISSYDAILSDLLRVIFRQKPEIIFTSDREVKFSELLSLNTLEEVRDNIISNEIESVMRNSHHEHFSWMEKKFGMKLRENLDVWPDFIELCERRNLLTHTGGVISEQYLKNCASHGRKTEQRVGDKLEVDIDYFRSAIDIVSEVGYKLIHTMWRKFSPNERGKADGALNEAGMNLIAAREYSLAVKLLRFGVDQKQHSSELIKRMMIVNLANAAKLGGNKVECDKVLSSHDWSATSYQFQICVAAVRNDFQEVNRLLKLGEKVIEITPSDFRDWPVFGDVRENAETQIIFEEVFGEPLERAHDKVSLAATLPDDDKGADGLEDRKLVH